MKKVIYCFSGTGNSLNAARIIAKEMGGATIVPVKKGAESDLAMDADVVGFLCPVYEWDIPETMKEFAKKLNNNGEPLYIFGSSTAVGQTFKAAQLATMRGVKSDAIDQLESEITKIIEEKLGNEQKSLDKAVSKDMVVSKSKEIISNRLPRGIKIVSVFRELPKTKNVEVRMMIAYNYDNVQNMFEEAAREALDKAIDGLKK